MDARGLLALTAKGLLNERNKIKRGRLSGFDLLVVFCCNAHGSSYLFASVTSLFVIHATWTRPGALLAMRVSTLVEHRSLSWMSRDVVRLSSERTSHADANCAVHGLISQEWLLQLCVLSACSFEASR